eukprot:4584786-Pleurochrysis_carterae.AAC.5
MHRLTPFCCVITCGDSAQPPHKLPLKLPALGSKMQPLSAHWRVQLEGARGCFIVEICFISNFFTWFYTRLYLYPVFVVWYGGWYGTREVITAPGVQGARRTHG